MTLPAPTIVIFDMDGTAVRHLDPRILNILEWIDNKIGTIRSLLSKFFSLFKLYPFPKKERPKTSQKKPRLLVHRALHKMRKKEVDQIVEPCPGIFELLDFLRSRRIPMALASNGLGQGYGHDILEKFGMEKYFHATIFREDIKRSKPDPEAILLALERTGIALNENDVIWYIGDRGKDVRAAIAAQKQLGCRVVPIAYAIKAAMAVIDANLPPEHIIPNYYDMHATLKELLK